MELYRIASAIYYAADVIMTCALISLIVAIFSRNHRSECKKIFFQGVICALLLWYISWLIG